VIQSGLNPQSVGMLRESDELRVQVLLCEGVCGSALSCQSGRITWGLKMGSESVSESLVSTA